VQGVNNVVLGVDHNHVQVTEVIPKQETVAIVSNGGPSLHDGGLHGDRLGGASVVKSHSFLTDNKYALLRLAW